MNVNLFSFIQLSIFSNSILIKLDKALIELSFAVKTVSSTNSLVFKFDIKSESLYAVKIKVVLM